MEHLIYVTGAISIAVAFNAAALHSVLDTGTRGAAFDPVLNTVVHLLVIAVAGVLVSAKCLGLYSIYAAVVAALYVYVGVIQPALTFATVGDPKGAFTSTAYPGSIITGLLIALVYLHSSWRCFSDNRSLVLCALQYLTCIMMVAALVVLPFTGLRGGTCNDQPDFPVAPTQSVVHRPNQMFSEYITMKDGVKIAVDVSLPAEWTSGQPGLPTVLLFTRYGRNRVLAFPWKYVGILGDIPRPYFSPILWELTRSFLPRGYACVGIDVRGTGASFGYRTVDLSQLEINDFKDVSDWVKQQPWCSGRVGSTGASYDGIVAALLAAHGGADVAGMLFSPINFFEDVMSPGSLACTSFVSLYKIFTYYGERNLKIRDDKGELPLLAVTFMNYILGGVFPVAGNETALNAASKEHDANWDLLADYYKMYDGFFGKVQVDNSGKMSYIEDLGFSPKVLENLDTLNAPVAMWAGYWDHASVRSALRLFKAVGGENIQVTFGPWAHLAQSCFTPRSPGVKPTYPLIDDMTDFIDCHLKDECTRLERRKQPVRYFQIGDESWRSAKAFPPPEAQWLTFYLSSRSGLVFELPDVGEMKTLRHIVSYTTSTGYFSRWNVVSHVLGKVPSYPNRIDEDGLLIFTTEPLQTSITMVGSPFLNLSLEAVPAGSSMVVFAYLEDIDPEGASIHYVTEAQLRVGHDVVRRSPDVGGWDRVEYSYLEEDFTSPIGVVNVELALQPIAYTFRRGHEIRLSLTGADVDNFDTSIYPNQATEWNVHVISSALQLPILQKE